MDYYKRFEEIKAKYNYSNHLIAAITGLSIGTVKNSLCSTGKFPNWLKLFVHHVDNIDIKQHVIETVKLFDIKPQVMKEVKPLTSDQLKTMVNKSKSKK